LNPQIQKKTRPIPGVSVSADLVLHFDVSTANVYL
jgi:hypothetical protein